VKEISTNSISLPLEEEWELKDNDESNKVWYNNSGDKLSLNFFSKKPDLLEEITDIHSLRNMYRNMITQANGAIVEIDKEYINSLLVLKTIFKFAQDPSGLAYLASYTIPRKSFSFVLKLQCHEHGITGMRESVILDEAIAKGLVEVATKKGWFFDPYDPDFQAPLLSNIADKEEYDVRFPNHPLSRVRKYLKMIKESVKCSEVLLKTDKFFLNFD
jgi:hypothetical protein